MEMLLSGEMSFVEVWTVALSFIHKSKRTLLFDLEGRHNPSRWCEPPGRYWSCDPRPEGPTHPKIVVMCRPFRPDEHFALSPVPYGTG